MKRLFWVILFLTCCVSHAEPIDFIVSASAGGPNDTVTRKISQVLETNSNLQFVVINKPGAAHTIAYNHIQSSNRPLLIMSTPEIVSHPVHEQVVEVFNAGYFTNTLFVAKKSGIETIKQFLDLARTREILFGHGGYGTYSHMAMERMCYVIRCLSVPYKSGSEGMLAVMSGQIDAYALASYGAKPFLENDKLTAIYEIRVAKEKSWFKLFAKNVSNKDLDTIQRVLAHQPNKFYHDMGLDK